MTYILLRDRCHSQRLPSHRIQRAQELGEIDIEENPAAAGLRARNESALRPRPNLFRVHVQECGGFMEVERFHIASP
jgi:hypothetical protein